MTKFDFGDGNGPVPAHQHPNGGGWVADTAIVADTAYVGPNALVFGNAMVFGNARVYGDARVYGKAQMCDVPTENDDDVSVTEEGCSENTDILIKMVTNEYIYYFQPSNAFVASATKMMANASIVISRKTNKLVKCRYALEDLIDERFNLK